MPHDLSKIDLLQGLDQKSLDQIAKSVSYQKYPADAWVLSVNDDTHDVLFIISGKVRVTLFALNGREIAFRDLGPGASCGEIAALDRQFRSANVICLEESIIALVPAETFRQMLVDYPRLADNTMRKLCTLVRSLSEKVYMLTAPVPQRICGDLLRLARQGMLSDNAARIKPSPKHADVAARVLTHREAVSRTIGILRREGIVQKARGELIVKDVARLTQKAVSEEVHANV